MTPICANIVGPPDSATSIKASIAACHSDASRSAFESLVMLVPASYSVTSFPVASEIRFFEGSFPGVLQSHGDFRICAVDVVSKAICFGIIWPWMVQQCGITAGRGVYC
jgi:hypothetical protein